MKRPLKRICYLISVPEQPTFTFWFSHILSENQLAWVLEVGRIGVWDFVKVKSPQFELHWFRRVSLKERSKPSCHETFTAAEGTNAFPVIHAWSPSPLPSTFTYVLHLSSDGFDFFPRIIYIRNILTGPSSLVCSFQILPSLHK